MAKDVVCGMMVDEKSAKYKTEFGGKTYYFCGPGCMTSFTANPGRYAKQSQSFHVGFPPEGDMA